jgi:hypothetical protein
MRAKRDHSSGQETKSAADRTVTCEVPLARLRQVRWLHRPKLHARNPLAIRSNEIRLDHPAHRTLGRLLRRAGGVC